MTGQSTDQNDRVLDQFTRQAEPYAALVNARQSWLKSDPLDDGRLGRIAVGG